MEFAIFISHLADNSLLHVIFSDPVVKADVDAMKIQLRNYSSQEIGKTIVYLNGTGEACRLQECNMGNLICDAVVRKQ